MSTAAISDDDAAAASKGLAGVVFLAAFASVLLPRWTAVLLPLLAIAWVVAARPTAAHWRQAAFGNAVVGNAVIWAFVAFTAYVALNASWALDPAMAYGRVGLAAVYLAFTGLLLVLAADCGARQVRRLAAAFAVGMLAATLLVCFEVVTGQSLLRAIFNLAPGLRPESSRHLTLRDDQVVRIAANQLNRNVAMAVLFLWPAMLIFRASSDAWTRRGAVALCIGAALVATLLSEHDSSRIAFLAGALAFLAFRWRPRLARKGLLALWCAAFLLVVPASLAGYQAGLHKAAWLPHSAQARIILWHTTATKLSEAPILGVGVRSTLVHDAEHGDAAEQPEGYAFPIHTGRHAHNIFLQTWFELGFVGAILLMTAGALLLTRMARLAASAQPYAYAQFAAFMGLAAASWGMWQSWLMAALGLAAIATALAAGRAAKSG